MRGRKRFQIEEQGGAVELIDDGVDERNDQAAKLLLGIESASLHFVEQLVQPIERVLMAGEKDVFLVAEIVVEVPLLHLERGRDLFHGRAVVAEPPKRGGGALEDLHARRRVRVGVARTPRTTAPPRPDAPGGG